MTQQTADHEQTVDWRWQTVRAKNPAFDHAFYTGVRTTKIYCKPSCPAKTPKPENITFFPTCAAAEDAGFRASLRCRPQISGERDHAAALVVKVCETIEANDEATLEFLAAELNVSQSHLQRTFKRALGVTPKEFADARKFEKFKREAKQTDLTAAIYNSGFGSSRRLYEKAAENLGMTPATYKKGGKNVFIRFAIVETDLGKLLVAATDKGVCKIAFGDQEPELIDNLRIEFPHAAIEPNNAELQTQAQAIVRHLNQPRRALDLPLDIRATAFQLRVWAALRKIPVGETRSYKQLAETIGNSQAVRAVARACALNPVELVNPCHRVVGADGKLTGYRWGVERKQRLLDNEKQTRDG